MEKASSFESLDRGSQSHKKQMGRDRVLLQWLQLLLRDRDIGRERNDVAF